jgi:hypothetical protein
MTSLTPITTDSVQPTHQESSTESLKRNDAADAPRTGSQSDHPKLYNGHRASWALGLSAPPLHIQCLEEQGRKTYIGLWKQLPGIPPHWSKKALSTEERHGALTNIEKRLQLDEKCRGILESHPDDDPSSKALVQKSLESLEQSKASLKTLWAALQTNRAIFGGPREKL